MNSVDGCSRQRKLGKWQMGMLASSVWESDRFCYLSLQGWDYKLSSWWLWILFSWGGLTVLSAVWWVSGRGSSFPLIPLAFWPFPSKSSVDFASDLPSLRVLNVLCLSSQTPYSVLLLNQCSFALDPVAPLCPAIVSTIPCGIRPCNWPFAVSQVLALQLWCSQPGSSPMSDLNHLESPPPRSEPCSYHVLGRDGLTSPTICLSPYHNHRISDSDILFFPF